MALGSNGMSTEDQGLVLIAGFDVLVVLECNVCG
ncbi:hypothetical protein COLO4_10006 [Corchorus olitorius]|uniref:Uncharacterized protein n=1 Tax=Corchorus olitorius TaxID=93759 RepID=A0A1R3KA92_9ROSI|nr:hypothetical protein COLO4_10006 [Corchorus olitorius]